jgi:hypothetical protein
MSTQLLERRFARIGARLKIEEPPWMGNPRLDVRRDRKGEYFDLRFTGGAWEVDVEVVDARRDDRHLLLLVRDGEVKSKFLCGHDERHWFVAAIPEDAFGVSGVIEALRALQPEPVQSVVVPRRSADPFSRRTAAFRRQGEWFFVPEPGLVVDDWLVIRDEPISRGGGPPHVIEFLHRRGGETVYVSPRYPGGLTQAEFDRLSEKARRASNWNVFVRDADVFAKGAVRHPDHATIVLQGWHRVAMNTEQRSRAMRHVVFLD